MALQKDIARFEAAWRAANGSFDPFALTLFEGRRKTLNAQQLARLDQSFRRRTRFLPAQGGSRLQRWRGTFASLDRDLRLAKNPALALLAINAADGHLRERAVRVAPMDDTAALTALLLRCNDWAEPVWRAALARLETVLPRLEQRALSPLCLFTLDRVATWKRGGAAAADMLMGHPSWPMAVEHTFTQTALGPLARTLRQLLCEPAYDWMLPKLAMGAESAFVRAVAVGVLLTGYARWKTGYDWVWHDKVFGLRRKVPVYGKRHVAVTPTTRDAVLRRACFDKSAKVRALAADDLISRGPEGRAVLVEALTFDKAPSVQGRMGYFATKWS